MELSSQSSTNGSSQEINRSSSVNNFIIPKKKRAILQEDTINSNLSIDQDDFLLYEDKKEQSIELQRLNEDVRNFLDIKSESGYTLTDMKFVKNRKLENEFVEYKRTMKTFYQKQGFKDSKIHDRKVFYFVYDEQEMLDLVKNGFNCVKSTDPDKNILGNSEEGIHFCKNLDVGLLKEYSKHKMSFYCIALDICFFMWGLVRPSKSNVRVSHPSDKDVIFSADIPKIEQPIEKRYHNSLLFKYDIDIESEIPKSRITSVQPVFVLKYQATSKYFNRTLIQPIKRKNIQKTRTVIPHQILNNKPNQKDVVIVETISNDNNKTSSQNNNQDNKNDSQPSIPANKPSSIKIKPISVSNNKKDNIQISSSCVLDSNFRPASPNQGQEMIIPEKNENEKDISSEEEEVDWFDKYEELFGDEIDSLYVKPSRWRYIYETTGRLDIKFKGAKKMTVKLDDIRKTKLKYLDQEKTSINLKDSTNKLILLYQSKRIKKLPCLASHASSSNVENNTQVKNLTLPIITNKNDNNKTVSKPVAPTSSKKSTGKEIDISQLIANLDKHHKQNQEAKKAAAAAAAAKAISTGSSIKQPSIKLEKFDHHEINKNKSKQVANQKPSKSSNSVGSVQAASGLSSEMTSLEKRLFEMEKIKSISSSANNAIISTTTSTSSSSSSLSSKKEVIKSSTSDPKRKKSFWDPDSDTEYDKIKKSKLIIKKEPGLEEKKEEEDEEEGEDDIVIVSKLNLNLPPVQYSKSYYDLNMNAFESDMKKFSNILSTSSPSSSTNLITTITKSPIKTNKNSPAESVAIEKDSIQNRRLSQSNRNKQRYIHHIVTSYAFNINNPPPPVNNQELLSQQFDVDNLVKIKKSAPNLDTSLNNSRTIEIHAGGFNCIEEHKFQRTISYLRRTQSFSNNSLIQLTDFEPPSQPTDKNITKSLYTSHSFCNLKLLQDNNSNNSTSNSQSPFNSINKKISLNDYKSKLNTSNLNQNEENKLTNSPQIPSVKSMPSLLISSKDIDEKKEEINSLQPSVEKTITNNSATTIKNDNDNNNNNNQEITKSNLKRKKKHKKKKSSSKKNKKKKNSGSSSSDSSLSSSSLSGSLSSLLSSTSSSDESDSSDMSISTSENEVKSPKKKQQQKNTSKIELEEGEEDGEINDSEDDSYLINNKNNKKKKSKHSSSHRNKKNRHHHHHRKKGDHNRHKHQKKDDDIVENEQQEDLNKSFPIKQTQQPLHHVQLPPPVTPKIPTNMPNFNINNNKQAVSTPNFANNMNKPPPIGVSPTLNSSPIINQNFKNFAKQNVNKTNKPNNLNRSNNMQPIISNNNQQTALLPLPLPLPPSQTTNTPNTPNFQQATGKKMMMNQFPNSNQTPSNQRYSRGPLNTPTIQPSSTPAMPPHQMMDQAPPIQPSPSQYSNNSNNPMGPQFSTFYSNMTNIDSNLTSSFNAIAKNFENVLNQMTMGSNSHLMPPGINMNMNQAPLQPPQSTSIQPSLPPQPQASYSSNNFNNSNNNINNKSFNSNFDDNYDSFNGFGYNNFSNNKDKFRNSNNNNNNSNYPNRFNNNVGAGNYNNQPPSINNQGPSPQLQHNYQQQQQQRQFNPNQKFNNNNSNRNSGGPGPNRFNRMMNNNSFNNNNMNNSRNFNNDQEDGEIL